MGVAFIGAAPAGGGQPYEQYFRTSGTWTNPGVSRAEVTCIGGSGAIGTVSYAASGAGGYAKANIDVTGVSSVPVIVGAGGTSAGDGGGSSFGSYLRAFGSRGVTSAYWASAAGYRRIPGVASSAGATIWEGFTDSAAPSARLRVAYGGGLFVAVGHYGTDGDAYFTTSPDGQTWTARTAPANAPWSDIIYAAGQFVAIAGGNNTSSIAATSPDGITWTQRSLGVSTSWGSLAYGNGTYVVVGSGYTTYSQALTSPDGITWTARSMPSTSAWSNVAYGSGLFVATRYDASANYATSPDGVTWTARTNLPQAAYWGNIGYGGGLFVMTSGGTPYAHNAASMLATSPDGTTWTQRNLTSAPWHKPVYGGGVWLVTSGSSTTNGQYLAYSYNGTSWNNVAAPPSTSYRWCGAAYGDGIFILTSGVLTSSFGAVARGYDTTNDPVPGFAGLNSTQGSGLGAAGGGAGGPATVYLGNSTNNYGSYPGPGIDGYCVGGNSFDPAPAMPGCGVSGSDRAGVAGLVIVRWWK